MNKGYYMGNLTKDFEIKNTDTVKIARGSMALNRGKDKDGKDRGADFINLVAFGKRADFFEKFGKKGRRFLIEAHVQTGSYQNQEGKTVYTTDFVIDQVEFADSKSSDAPAQAEPQGDFIAIPDGFDEELPWN